MADISLEGMTPEAINGLAALAKGLSDDPKTRTRMLELVKERDPSLSIPEIDLPAKFTTALAEERTKREALENKLREDDVRREIMAKRQEIQDMGIAKDKIPEVEKLMTERSIGDHKTAAEFYLAQQKMGEPTPPPGAQYKPMTLPVIDAKPFGGNMRTWGKAQAAQLFQDIRAGKAVA